MSEAHELNVKLKVIDENTQPVMAGVLDQFNRTAEGLTRSMRGVTAEFDKLKGGMEGLDRHAETHVGKGVSESFGKANNAVLAFASGLTGVGLGLGISEIARKTGELVRESSNLAAQSEVTGLKVQQQLHLSDTELKQVKASMEDLHRTTGITTEALTQEWTKFRVATSAQNLTLTESLKIYKNIGDFSRTTGADFDKMASMVTMAMTHMKRPVEETKGVLDGMAAVLGPMADDFARHYQRITPQLQQYGMAETKVMEIEAARFAALQQFYGEDRIGLMRAANAEMQVMDQAMDPTSRMGMRVRAHILELQVAGRKEEIAPYIAQTMKEEGAFEREAGGAYTQQAIFKQRYWQIEQTATFIEQGMKAEEEVAKNTQKQAEAKKLAGEVARREAERENTQEQIRRDADEKIDHAKKTIGEIWNKRVVKTLAHPEEFEGGPDVAYTELAKRNRLRIQRRLGLPHIEPTPSELIGQALGGGGEQSDYHPAPPPRRRGWFHRYASGGTVEGAPGEEVPIIAHGGETVVPAGDPGLSYGGGAPRDDRIETWPTDQQLFDTYAMLSMRPWVTMLKKGSKFATMSMDMAAKAKKASAEDKNPPPPYFLDKMLHRLHIPGYEEGGTVGGEPGQPSLIVAHGGETVSPENKTKDNTEATKENTEAIKELLLEFRRGPGPGGGYAGRRYAYTPGAGEAGVPPEAGAIGGPYGGGGGAGGPGGGGYAPGPGGGGGTVPPILGPGGHPGSAPGGYPGAPGGTAPALPGQEGVGLTGVGGYNFMSSGRAAAMGMNVRPGSMADMVQRQTAAGTITANKYAADDIAGFINDLHAAGAPLKNFSGVYAGRAKRGGTGWSEHAYGNAVDIETGLGSGPDNSPFLYAWAQAHPKEFAEIQAKHHMRNLDTSSGARMHDWGHFEWTPAGRDKTVVANAETGHLTDSTGHTSGSNLSNLATENASGAWGRSRMSGSFMRQVSSGAGELYGIPVGAGARGAERYPAWAQAKMAEITRTGGIDRSRFGAELQNNPQLLETVLGIGAGENVESAQKLFESMMNRADLMGTTLAHEATPRSVYGTRGYYAGFKPGDARNPAIRAKLLTALQAALGAADEGGVKQGDVVNKQISQAYMGGVTAAGGNAAGISADRVFAEGYVAAGGDPSHLPPSLRSVAGGGGGVATPPPPHIAEGPQLPFTRPGAAKVGQPFMPDMGPGPTGGDITASALADLSPEQRGQDPHLELAGRNLAELPDMSKLDAPTRRRIIENQRRDRERARHEANVHRAEELTKEELEYDRTHNRALDARSRRLQREHAAEDRHRARAAVPLPRERPAAAGPRGPVTIGSHPVAGVDGGGGGGGHPGTMADTKEEIRLQHGGIVTGPTHALIGEAGPEAVIPLGRGGSDLASLYAMRAELESRPIRMSVESPKLRASDGMRRQTARALRERDREYYDRKDDNRKLSDIAI